MGAAIVLGDNHYGKAEIRVVRVNRETPRHDIRDLNVSTSLSGAFEAAHVSGDQSAVLPTDSQKNTVFAFAKSKGIGALEEFALGLARHFVSDVEPVTGARVTVEEYAWQRVEADGTPHDHTFLRHGPEVRTTEVAVGPEREVVLSGVTDLVVLKSTGSEFHGFLADGYTTLAPATDRVMATSLTAQWRWSQLPAEQEAWDAAYDEVRRVLLSRYAVVHSLALQQTLWEMGKGVLEARGDIAEVRLSAPNKHHFLVDLAPFGLDNPGEVFFAADRPYGLIEVVATRDDDPGTSRRA